MDISEAMTWRPDGRGRPEEVTTVVKVGAEPGLDQGGHDGWGAVGIWCMCWQWSSEGLLRAGTGAEPRSPG